jgi:ribose transport system permease protein
VPRRSDNGVAHIGSVQPAHAAKGDPVVALGLRLLAVGPLLILVLLVVGIALVTPAFLKPINLGNILAQTSVIAIVAMGQQLVILTRGIDLSVGANLALSSVIGGLVFQATGGTVSVILAMLLTGAVVGAINGLVYVYGRLPHPFIITLATLSICRGLALALAPGHTTMRGMPDAIAALGSQTFLGLPLGVFVVALVAGLLLVLTRFMVAGRWITAVGGNPQAALGMGIPVKGVLVATYIISGLCAGIGAVVLAGRTDAASPVYGQLLELDTIAAVIIGGASFLGGRGHLGHALIGAVLIGVIRNALNLQNVEVFYQMVAIGVIIVLAVEADVLRSHLEARARTLQARGSA